MKPSSIPVDGRRIIAAHVFDVVFFKFSRKELFFQRILSELIELHICIFQSVFPTGQYASECPQHGPSKRSVSRELIQVETPRVNGDTPVLTFFEYLKQRAYEAILDGAHEAIEFLEANKDHSASKSEETLSKSLEAKGSQLTTQGSLPDAKKAGQQHPQVESESTLPPPRRRGRPRKDRRDEK